MLVGDVMADILFQIQPKLKRYKGAARKVGSSTGQICTLDLHRPSNTDNPEPVASSYWLFPSLKKVLFAVHPGIQNGSRNSA